MNFTSGMQIGGQDATFGGMRNRIINGDMRIDQRNAGAALTINQTANTYALDRWRLRGESSDGVFTVVQSSTAPTGFQNSLLVTVTTADASIGASQLYAVEQLIEGYNVADLGWGAAGAATVTLSFWVRSSLTGVFGGSLRNDAGNRSYPFTYTINAANTFEYKTITIVGDTTGTWEKTTSAGVWVNLSLGVGSDRKGTAGAWNSNNNFGATGETAVISTISATFYITGVQLEKGSSATSFEHRMYGQEYALCQRYFQIVGNGAAREIAFGAYWGTSEFDCFATFQTSMRTSPTVYQVSGTDYFGIEKSGGDDTFNAWTGIARGTTFGCLLYTNGGVSGTAGFGAVALTNNALSFLGFQSEL
jgi:hypothetical protein